MNAPPDSGVVSGLWPIGERTKKCGKSIFAGIGQAVIGGRAANVPARRRVARARVLESDRTMPLDDLEAKIKAVMARSASLTRSSISTDEPLEIAPEPEEEAPAAPPAPAPAPASVPSSSPSSGASTRKLLIHAPFRKSLTPDAPFLGLPTSKSSAGRSRSTGPSRRIASRSDSANSSRGAAPR